MSHERHAFKILESSEKRVRQVIASLRDFFDTGCFPQIVVLEKSLSDTLHIFSPWNMNTHAHPNKRARVHTPTHDTHLYMLKCCSDKNFSPKNRMLSTSTSLCVFCTRCHLTKSKLLTRIVGSLDRTRVHKNQHIHQKTIIPSSQVPQTTQPS